MGYRGGSSDLGGPNRASARRFPVFQRRTSPWFWCGVFFCAAFTIDCGSPNLEIAPPRQGLTIGVPEGSVVSAEIGVRELVNVFTLEGLTQVDVDGRALPRLAEKWTWEQDGSRLRIHLRPGVTFHDATPLVPELAVNMVREAVARPANRALYPSLNDIVDVRQDGNQQIVIDLSRPSALLAEDLLFPLAIRSASETIGTGPYRVARRDAGQVVLEGFDQYYLGAPNIRQVVLTPFDTIRTAWTSLLRGEVDMITDVPGEAVEFVQSNEVEVLSFARRYQFLVAFNSRRPPLRSPTVRRALNLAVNREALIADVLQGHGVPAAGPFWPRHWAYDASVVSSSFDRTFATTLLAGAGLESGAASAISEIPGARIRFTCLIPAEFSVLERIALHLQRQLYEVGVDMQFEVVPIEEYDLRIRTGRFDAVLIDLISGPTLSRPYVFWGSARRFEGINEFGYENAEAERLFGLLRASTNEAAIRSTVSRLQRVFIEDPPALFLAWNERARAVTRRFRVVEEPGQDPLHTIWQWTENTDR